MGNHSLLRQSVLALSVVLSPISVAQPAYAQAPSVLEVGKFSAAMEGAALPDGWKPLTFKKIERHTVYKVVKDGGTVAVKAVSEASASGLTREIKISLKEYPIPAGVDLTSYDSVVIWCKKFSVEIGHAFFEKKMMK